MREGQVDGIWRRPVVTLGLGLLFLFIGLFVRYNDAGLGYDEGDYYRAVTHGFWNNWTDADDIPTAQFIATGLDAVQGNIERAELSKMMRSTRSAAFYRHYHPPVPFYPSMAIGRLLPDLGPEKTLRYGLIAFVLVWFLGMFLLSRRWPALFPPWILLIPATGNWLASLSGFNMHVPFALAVATFFLAWRAITDEQRDLHALRIVAIGALAVALFSVEYSVILLGMLALWMLLQVVRADADARRQLFRVRLKDVGILLAFMVALWPAGVLSLGLLKAYAQQAYIALFRLGAEPPAFDNLSAMLFAKFSPSPLDFLLVVIALVILLRRPKRLVEQGYLFVSFGLVVAMLVLQLNPALVLPWYLASFCIITIVLYLPLGAEESGLECSMSWPPLPVMVASLVLACGIFFYVPPGLTMSRDIVTVIVKNEGKVPSAVTADYEIAPALGGYFPDATIDRFLVDAMPAAELADSLDSWRTRGPVAIRREDWSGIDTSETMTVGGRRIFRQNR